MSRARWIRRALLGGAALGGSGVLALWAIPDMYEARKTQVCACVCARSSVRACAFVCVIPTSCSHQFRIPTLSLSHEQALTRCPLQNFEVLAATQQHVATAPLIPREKQVSGFAFLCVSLRQSFPAVGLAKNWRYLLDINRNLILAQTESLGLWDVSK